MQIISRNDAREQGLKKYFTGAPCKRGHISPRYVNGTCCRCAADYPQKMPSPEYAAERQRKYRVAHPERLAQQRRDYRSANIERVSQHAREYRAANPEKVKQQYRKYYEANPERFKQYNRNRRARKRGAEGHHTSADASAILERQKHKCVYCAADLRKAGKHLDHIMPLVLGGSNAVSNLQYLCPSCNMSKGGRDPLIFAKRRGRLL